mgnify:CR=1 FL=1
MKLTDKHLIILGELLTKEAHGYELVERLSQSATPIQVGKANAYQLLSKLEAAGYVVSREERPSNRPPRQVFSATAQGQEAFTAGLRNRLTTSEKPQHADGVSLSFLETLPPSEAAELLSRRLTQVQTRLHQLQAVPKEERDTNPRLDFLFQSTELECSFLGTLILRLAMQEQLTP